MSALYNRQCRLIIPSLGKAFEGLRTSFKIAKSLAKEPNTATITIYNLSEDSRAALNSKGTRVQLEAGYTGTTAVIFSGDTSFIDHTHEGPDWKTHIECADGEIATQHARVSESFKPPVTKAQVFQKLVNALGVDGGTAIAAFKDQVEQFVSGYVAHGRASAEIDKVLKNSGFKYSIQDGRMQLLRDGEATTDPLIYLTPDSGLIGSPQHGSPIKPSASDLQVKTPQVLKAKSLLQPGFAPGRRVVIDSVAIKKGTFLINSMLHSGDTFGQEWFTELELLPYAGAL